MPRFYSENKITENTVVETDARIAQHVRVLRVREGEGITLFDGNGGEVPATLMKIDKRIVEAQTGQRIVVERELPVEITLFAGLIANDRFDWLIQKATELGVAAIQPVYTERSQRIPGDVVKRVDHWRGVVIAACEQCGRNRLPVVSPPISLADAVASTQTQSSVLLDAQGDFSVAIASTSLAVFVGPEGGFSAAELELLRNRCDHKLRIGRTVLRAETAAISSIAVLSSLTSAT
jgi:16S rRNA (uracil1498-N3)-methyltransferase